jgi:predicted DNA-binding antitoxin AbrB/MazE fold protein
MTTAVDAIYEDGVFKPDKPVGLKDKTKVRLVIESEPDQTTDDDPTGWKTAMELKGCIKAAPPDMAANHDKYLYGASDE